MRQKSGDLISILNGMNQRNVNSVVFVIGVLGVFILIGLTVYRHLLCPKDYITIIDGPNIVYDGPIDVCKLKGEKSAKSSWLLYQYYYMKGDSFKEKQWKQIWDERRLGKETTSGSVPDNSH
jgi:hypothetical protein